MMNRSLSSGPPHILALNGPKLVGKDTFVLAARHHFAHLMGDPDLALHVRVSRPLKERTHALYGIGHLPHDHFDAVKDQPRPEFFGLTLRQAYIEVSERYFKPLHGPAFFGHLALEDYDRQIADVKTGRPSLALIECGFSAEVQPILDRFGADRIQIVRIHGHDVDGGEITFAGDSREWIDLPGVAAVDIVNRKTACGRGLAAFTRLAEHLVETAVALKSSPPPVAAEVAP